MVGLQHNLQAPFYFIFFSKNWFNTSAFLPPKARSLVIEKQTNLIKTTAREPPSRREQSPSQLALTAERGGRVVLILGVLQYGAVGALGAVQHGADTSLGALLLLTQTEQGLRQRIGVTPRHSDTADIYTLPRLESDSVHCLK